MANNWCEQTPNLVKHEFEIYDNCSSTTDMYQFHGHSFYELRFILHGDVTHYSENAASDLSPGNITIIPPGMFHRVTPRNNMKKIADYARVLLYVSTDFMHSLDTEQLKISELFDAFGYPGTQHLALSDQRIVRLVQPLQEIVRKNRDDDPLTHLFNRAQVTLVLAQVAQEVLHTHNTSNKTEDASLVPRVIAYINANLSENLSLDSLSERFFVSKFYLSHQFKQYTQLSLHQYVLTRRMMHAQILLRSGQSPTSVATACGYHEYSSFYKAFLRETGQSPRTFE